MQKIKRLGQVKRAVQLAKILTCLVTFSISRQRLQLFANVCYR